MSNFWSNIFRREAPAPVGVPATTDPQHASNQPAEGSGSYEEKIIPVADPQSALTVSAVYRAIELRSKTIGQMVMQYQVKDSDKGNFTQWNRGFGKRMNYLLQVEPNPIMTATSLWEQVTISRLQLGNGFVYIERDVFGDPVALWLAVCGGYNMITGTYTLSYLGEHGLVTLPSVSRRDVLHFPNTFRDINGVWGIPTLRYAFQTLTLNRTESQQALDTAAKGGRMKLIIGEDQGSSGVSPIALGLFDKKEMDKYAMEIQQKLYKNDVVALRALKSVQNISMSAQDQQMIELIGMTQDDVARFYATPRPLLMLDTNSHYTTYTNATMEYLSRTIAPDGAEMEAECFRKLIGQNWFGTRRIHLCEQPLLRMDKESQAKVDEINLRTGAKTVNEIRQEHDMPAVDNGDIVYVSTNLAELGSAKLRDIAGGGRPTEEPTEPKPKEVEEGKQK